MIVNNQQFHDASKFALKLCCLTITVMLKVFWAARKNFWDGGRTGTSLNMPARHGRDRRASPADHRPVPWRACPDLPWVMPPLGATGKILIAGKPPVFTLLLFPGLYRWSACCPLQT
jgi:hypothetical protein